ncbi:MAG: glycosyltransferase 25 family er [Chlamydiales bacterium]|jgi:GR25 family glycosyltransferase involved in LPS biosynthesis|nr:glycosyltransferase 25 family er [Chlamydiales bacterium]
MKKKYLALAVLITAVMGISNYSQEINWYLREAKIGYVINHNADKALESPLKIDQTWVILLERDQARKEYVEKDLFKKQDIPDPHAIFSAIDGKKLTNEQIQEFVQQKIFTENAVKTLKRGEIGCALSHYTLWKRVAEDPDINSAMILEDDVQLLGTFQNSLAGITKELPQDFDFVFLYNDDSLTHLAKTPSPHLFIPVYPSCLYGYIISKVGARKILQQVFPIAEPIDNALSRTFRSHFSTKRVVNNFFGKESANERQKYFNIYTVRPTLISTNKMPSNIQVKE